MNAKRLRVAVIGAGASGIAAVKCCLDEDMDTTCFEKSDGIGGLWRFTEKAEDGRAGVYRTTVINSSKELLAYSTFPPPADFPNFMHHTKLHEYISLYANEYGLRQYIKLNTEVVSVSKANNFQETGRWVIAFKDSRRNEVEKDTFDAVLVCTGHHFHPNDPSPSIPGRQDFQGRVLHGHEYRDHRSFIDRRVIVVGLGNTGGDLAAELSRHADTLLLSTRRGSWVVNRIGYRGQPYDVQLNTRLIHYIMKVFPHSIANEVFEFVMNTRFDHEVYGLKPTHRILSQHPLVNDELPARIANGTVTVVPDITSFRKDGVVTSDGAYHDVDDVIFATGYKIKFPFLPDDVVSADDHNKLSNLYKHVFPLSLRENPSLAIIGNVQPLGGLMPIAEMQSRWATRVFKKSAFLPSYDAMLQECNLRNGILRKRYVDSGRHTIQVDYMECMDSVASEIGVQPNLLGIAVSNPRLFWKILTGPGTSYQYRIHGPGSWDGAISAIEEQSQRIAAGFTKSERKVRSRGCGKSITIQKQQRHISMRALLFVISLLIFYWGVV